MGDLISRQAMLDMANGWTYNFCDPEDEWAAMKEIRELPSAQPERKKPDHGFMWICPECGLEVHSDFTRCVRCGWDRPSAERQKGRWEKIDDTEFHVPGYFCSACSCECEDWSKKPTYKFCPNCGADMRGGEK